MFKGRKTLQRQYAGYAIPAESDEGRTHETKFQSKAKENIN
jgi:hypothetical protein